MPTLVRLLTIVATLAAVAFAIMAALVHFVEPTPRPVVIDVPLPQLRPPAPEPAGPSPADGAGTSEAAGP